MFLIKASVIYLRVVHPDLDPPVWHAVNAQALGTLYKTVLNFICVAVGKSKHWLIKYIELLDSLASPLLSVLFLEKDGHLITGSADGQVSDWDTWPWKTQKSKICVHLKSFRAHGCFRCGAFLLAMTLSATWWKKWICWRWKEGIKGAKRRWATMQVMLSSTGWDGDFDKPYLFLPSCQVYSALGCFILQWLRSNQLQKTWRYQNLSFQWLGVAHLQASVLTKKCK